MNLGACLVSLIYINGTGEGVLPIDLKKKSYVYDYERVIFNIHVDLFLPWKQLAVLIK
jgi:hypothetical protein